MSLKSFRNFRKTQLIVIFWITGIAMGAWQAWDGRHHMGADGMSYLDIADAYIRGDWENAVNATWSPLYSWLLGLGMLILKPAPYTEFPVVHIVNFMIYLFTLGCFHFFILQLINSHRSVEGKDLKSGTVTFSESAWIAIGYTLFLQSSLIMIGIWDESPDMLVAAFVYLASGIILRIRNGMTNYVTYALLGVTLGFGYLAKAVMFPLAFVFLLVSMFSIGNLKKALPHAMTCLICFLFIASPFIIAISNAKSRITFGDAGKYNYWLAVDNYGLNINRHWDGTDAGNGTPKHPVRKIFNNPRVYEFGTPVSGTYPVWYDPSYWYDGLEINFDLEKQLIAIKVSLINYYHIFYPGYCVLLFGSVILYLTGRRRWNIVNDIAKYWILLIPAVIALGMYSIIYVLPRYVAPFIVLLWLGILSAIRLHDSEESKRLLNHVSIIIVLVLMMITPKHLIVERSSPPPLMQPQVAAALNKMGVLPGDKVASIGYSFPHFWARLARVQIVAEIPSDDAKFFWEADSKVQSEVIRAFKSTGAKAVVTGLMKHNIPPSGWQRIENSDYFIYMLSK